MSNDGVTGVKCPGVAVKLLGQDGNVFYVIGSVAQALERAHFRDEAEEFTSAAFACGSYDEVLQLVMQYVEVV